MNLEHFKRRKMITKKDIYFEYPLVELWYEDKFITQLTKPEELVNTQIAVANSKTAGYYLIMVYNQQEHKIVIKPNGELSHHPEGLFDGVQKLFNERVKQNKGGKGETHRF